MSPQVMEIILWVCVCCHFITSLIPGDIQQLEGASDRTRKEDERSVWEVRQSQEEKKNRSGKAGKMIGWFSHQLSPWKQKNTVICWNQENPLAPHQDWNLALEADSSCYMHYT